MTRRWFSRRAVPIQNRLHRASIRLTTLEDKITPTQLLPDLFPLGAGHLSNWTVSTTAGVSTLQRAGL